MADFTAYKVASGELSSATKFNNLVDAIEDQFTNYVTTSGATLLETKLLVGDANPAFRILGSGKLAWGAGGVSPVDSSIQRIGAAQLQTDGEFRSNRTSATATGFAAVVSGDSTIRYEARADGRLSWGPGNAALDTNLYRASANTLQTDDNFAGGGGETVLDASGFIRLGEMTAPSNAAANSGRLFVEDNGAGKTRLAIIFATGAKQIIATEP
jgi:hypothetical protein